MRAKLPTISVCIATYNSGKTLDKCLKLVRQQNYPQSKIEIILGDGGSTDDTYKIAKKYNAKVIKIPPEKQHAEYNRGVAFNKAKGELVLIIDHDNFLPLKDWILEMVDPLLENSEMVATSTAYYKYDRKYDLLDRYFALFGASEPLPWFLKKADRMMATDKKWPYFGDVVDCGNYWKIVFGKNPRYFPSIGSNGCLMRRKLVARYADVRPDYHYPIDVLFDVAKKGYSEYGIVKNSIIHLTHSRGLVSFIKRKWNFVQKYHFEETNKRRWSVVMKGDEIGLILFAVYSLTFIKPTYDSFRGYLKIRDIAWFVHPLMCFATTTIYGYMTMRRVLLHKRVSV